MKKLLVLICGIMLGLGVASTASAVPTLITDRGVLAGTDYIDWGDMGPTYTQVLNPFDIQSHGGAAVHVSKTKNTGFEIRTQGDGWNGNFTIGDHVLWTTDMYVETVNPIAFNFGGVGILAGGAQIGVGLFNRYFTAKIEIFDSAGNSLASFTEDGHSNEAFEYEDEDAIFIGISSDVQFYALELSLVYMEDTGSIGPWLGDFVINQFDFTPRVSAPEPATMLLLGFGLIGIAGLRRKLK